MKKHIAFLLALIFCAVSFASCNEVKDKVKNESGLESKGEPNLNSSVGSSDASNIEKADPEPEYPLDENEIRCEEYYFGARLDHEKLDNRSDYCVMSSKPKTFKTIVIKNKSDAEELIGLLGGYSDSFIDWINDLPENYFDEKLLLVNDFSSGDASYKRDVIGVFKDGNVLTVKYTYFRPEIMITVNDNRIVAVEIKRDDIEGVEEFRAYSEELLLDKTPRKIEFQLKAFSGEVDFSGYTPAVVDYHTVIHSENALREFLKKIDSSEFSEFSKGLSRKYFREKALLVYYKPSSDEVISEVFVDKSYGLSIKTATDENNGGEETGSVIYIAVIDAKEASGAYYLFKE